MPVSVSTKIPHFKRTSLDRGVIVDTIIADCWEWFLAKDNPDECL
jgi:hypothetical protein